MKNTSGLFKNILLTIFQIANTTSSVGLTFISKNIMDSLNNGDEILFFKSSLASVFVIGLVIISQLISIHLENEITFERSKKIRLDSMKSVLNYKDKDLTNVSRSKIFSYFSKALDIYEESNIRNKLSLRGSLMTFIFSILAIGVFDKKFLFIVITSIAMIIFTPKIFSKKIEKLSEKRIKAFEDMVNKTKEYLNLFYIINVFNINKIINDKYGKTVDYALTCKKKLENYIGISNSILAFVSIITTISIYIVGGWMVLNASLTIGSLIAVAHLVSNLSIPMLEIIYGINELSATNNIKDEIRRLTKYLDYTKKEAKPVHTMKLSIGELSFSDKILLTNIDLEFTKGKNYVIIGENGSGKSTIGKIICGLINIDKGKYYVNGRQIQASEMKEYKTLYVSSENQLFEDTALANIKMATGKGEGKAGKLIEDKIIDKHVGVLSDGERQKLVLYRSLLSQFDVKVYDEPEKSLDQATRSNLFDLLLTDKDAINIIITHKLDEDLKKFDEIIYIKDGKVESFKSYDDFIEKTKVVSESA